MTLQLEGLPVSLGGKGSNGFCAPFDVIAHGAPQGPSYGIRAWAEKSCMVWFLRPDCTRVQRKDSLRTGL